MSPSFPPEQSLGTGRPIFDRLRVFVSSSMAELAPERVAIKEALADLEVDAWVFEEDAGARPQSAQRTFQEELERADLYLGMFWKRLGPYTLEEFDLARSLGKDCLIYEKREHIDGQREASLQTFLDRLGDVKTGLTVKYFTSAEELRELVKQDIARWQAHEIRDRRTFRIRGAGEPAQGDDRRALESLLGKVRHFWIDGVLHASLHGQALLELTKETRPEAIASPWQQVLELPDQTRRGIPAGQSLEDVFRELGGSLLVLGAPGSGKTMTLLQLTQALLDRAQRDPKEPVPVVFNLSTWGAGYTLKEWLVGELTSKYQIPARLGREWVERQLLLPMLDGLDEVASEHRARCVQAINRHAESVGVPGIAVCCRLEAYTALPVRLKLAGAMCLQPLTSGQVRDYVSSAGPALSELAIALEREEALGELAQSPLMLDVMMVAFRDAPVGTVESGTVHSWQHRVFQRYTERMLARGVSRARVYPPDRTSSFLRWLASGMLQRAQSIFLIEGLQPCVLETRGQRAMHVLASRSIGGVLFAVLLALCVALGSWAVGGQGPVLSEIASDAISIALVAGPLYGIGLGLLDFACMEVRGAGWRSAGMSRYLGVLAPGLAFCAAASIGLLAVAASDEDVLAPTLYILGGGAACLLWGRRWLRQSYAYDIRGVESLVWSWKHARYGAALGLAVGLAIAALMLSSMGPFTGSERALIPQISTILGLSFCFAGSLLGGVRTGLVQDKSRPNEGMRMSLRNAVLCLLGGTAVVTVGVVLIFVAGTGLALLLYPEALRADAMPELGAVALKIGSAGFAAGLFAGTCAGLWFGGLELIHHATLRLMLTVGRPVPIRLAGMLEEAKDLVLLQSVGSGYMFVHRLLLEHLAAQPAPARPLPTGS